MSKRRALDSKIRTSQTFARLSYRQRDLWQGLIVMADDQGRLPGVSAFVRSAVWPFDDITLKEVEEDLTCLEGMGNILRYEATTGAYIQIVNWWKYQQPQWAGPSDFPPPPGWCDRQRYHGAGHQIILLNWDQPGGFTQSQTQTPEPVKLPDEIPPELSGDLSGDLLPDIPEAEQESAKVKQEEVKEEEDIKEIRGASAAPLPPTSSKPGRDAVLEMRKEIQKCFLVLSGLPVPRAGTKGEIKETQKLWWTPFEEILELSHWDVDIGKELIGKALERSKDLTISDPHSLIKTVRSIYAEAHRNGNGKSVTTALQEQGYVIHKHGTG